MEERFEISFSEGGVGALETIITGGLANAVEKGLDTITGNDDHGWYCTIEDSITELKVTCWGPTKEEAQEKALTYIWKDIEDFEYEQEKEEEREEERKRIQYEKEQSERRRFSNVSTSDNSSSSDVIIKIIAWIVGICLAVFVVIWLAINVVIPVAMLNSALIFAILTFVFKNKKTLFASLALVGGAYLIIDVTNGWLSLLFVENVVKSPYWISAFVYINAAAIGFCTWLLISPLWLKSNQLEPNNKRKSLLIKIGLILIVAITIAIAPFIYNIFQNPLNGSTPYSNNSSTNNKVMTMRFTGYSVGDNAYLVFDEVSTNEEYSFMIDSDTRRKLNGLELLIVDENSEFGEAANPKYLNELFIIEASYQSVQMNGWGGEVISQDMWVINKLKLQD